MAKNNNIILRLEDYDLDFLNLFTEIVKEELGSTISRNLVVEYILHNTFSTNKPIRVGSKLVDFKNNKKYIEFINSKFELYSNDLKKVFLCNVIDEVNNNSGGMYSLSFKTNDGIYSFKITDILHVLYYTASMIGIPSNLMKDILDIIVIDDVLNINKNILK